MSNKKLFRTGCAGTVIAALCCFTPVLVIGLGAVGLSAWLGWLDYVLFPMMFASLGVVAYALYLRAGRSGPSPKAVIIIAVIAMSALIIWLEFHYAIRISLASVAAVAGYGFFLHKTSPRPDDVATPEEQS
jgi:hypothetical protein